MKYSVFGLGNPLIDIIIHVEEDILNSLELVKDSMNLVDVERQQEIIKKCQGLEKVTSLGGSCANTMVMISQLGSNTAFCGKAGNDELGDEYNNQLINSGVDSFLIQAEGMTGSTVILVTPDAGRTMNTALGMCQHLSKDDLKLEAIADSQYIYIEGYSWDTPSQKETVRAALEHAKNAGTKIAFTLSDPFCVERHKDEFQDLLDNYVDLLFCNQAEAKFMTGFSQLNEQISQLSESVSHTVITLGDKGARIFEKGKIVDIKPFGIKALDSTGAGDSFAAGYLYGVTQGYSTEDSGMLASYCAATIVSIEGPRFEGDFREHVKEYLPENKKQSFLKKIFGK